MEINNLREQRSKYLEEQNQAWDKIRFLKDEDVKNFLKENDDLRIFYQNFTSLQKNMEKEDYEIFLLKFQGWAEKLIISQKKYVSLSNKISKLNKQMELEKERLKIFPNTVNNEKVLSISEIVSELDINKIDFLEELHDKEKMMKGYKMTLEEENMNFQIQIEENIKTILMIDTKMKFFDVKRKYLNEILKIQEDINNLQGI